MEIIPAGLVEVGSVQVDAADRVQTDLAAVVGQFRQAPQEQGGVGPLRDLERQMAEMEGAADDRDAIDIRLVDLVDRLTRSGTSNTRSSAQTKVASGMAARFFLMSA